LYELTPNQPLLTGGMDRKLSEVVSFLVPKQFHHITPWETINLTGTLQRHFTEIKISFLKKRKDRKEIFHGVSEIF
jgi:hypothetical protein